MTETAFFADVVLPATAFPEKDGTFTNTDRRVQLGRKAVEAPGEAKPDWWIIQEIAQRLGLDWNYTGPADVFAEMREGMDSIKGMSWERLEQEDSITYPCESPEDPGQGIIFINDFPTESGRAKFVPAKFTTADELPDDEYPFVLNTGRQLEHWHTGAMTRRATVLDAIEPVAVVSLHPNDLEQLGAAAGDMVKLSSRRGTIECFARADDGMDEGQVFLPFCFKEAAANLLTNDALDPVGKIPEFKFCALKVETVQSQ